MYRDRDPYVDHCRKQKKRWALIKACTNNDNVIDFHYGARSLGNGRADVWRGHMAWRTIDRIVHMSIRTGNLIFINFRSHYDFKI